MQAMVLEQPADVSRNPLVASQVPDPQPGPGEIRVRIAACGVCRTDLHTVEGELKLPRLPVVPGHQVVGRVDGLGPGAGRYSIGDRVGVPWLHWTCGQCKFCRSGKENLCEAARFTGLHADGGYSEAMVVREDFAYPIPAGFGDLEAAPLLCAGVIGFRALRLSEIRPGGRLGFYGFGASASIAIQVARHWGCRVFVFSRGAHHRELAQQMGAAWTGSPGEVPPEKLDSAVVFAPAGPQVLDALRALDKGGVCALAGIYMSPIPEMEYGLIYHERTLRSAANCTRLDAIELLRLAAEIPIRTEVEVFPLADANRALQKLKAAEVRAAAVLRVG